MFKLVSVALALASVAAAVPSSLELESRDWSAPSHMPFCNVQGNWYYGKWLPGSIFWTSNELDGNYLMSAAVGWNGKLTFTGAVWTGGLGGRGGNPNPMAPDPLFSQDALNIVGNTMVAVNAGSNTVTMFEVDESNPTMANLIGAPVWSGGTFPVSATISKATGNVCVLNGGHISNVACFSSDKKLGLTLMPDSVRTFNHTATTPPSGPPNTVSQVLFSEDGKQLFAAVKGAPDAPGFIAAWDVMEDGSLSQSVEMNTVTQGGALPFSMTFIEGAERTAMLNTDPAIGFSVLEFEGTKFSKEIAVTIEGQMANCWSEFSPKTKNYYLADSAKDILNEVSVDPATLEAEVVAQHQFPEGSAILDMHIMSVDGKEFIYILAPGTQSILVAELKSAGQLKIIQTFDVAKAAEKAGITVSTSLQGINGFVKGG